MHLEGVEKLHRLRVLEDSFGDLHEVRKRAEVCQWTGSGRITFRLVSVQSLSRRRWSSSAFTSLSIKE
jgi:hypothetical protein